MVLGIWLANCTETPMLGPEGVYGSSQGCNPWNWGERRKRALKGHTGNPYVHPIARQDGWGEVIWI